MRRIGEHALAYPSGREFAIAATTHQAHIFRARFDEGFTLLAFDSGGQRHYLIPHIDDYDWRDDGTRVPRVR